MLCKVIVKILEVTLSLDFLCYFANKKKTLSVEWVLVTAFIYYWIEHAFIE